MFEIGGMVFSPLSIDEIDREVMVVVQPGSEVYHETKCRKLPKKNIESIDRGEAKKRGRRPCKNCLRGQEPHDS